MFLTLFVILVFFPSLFILIPKEDHYGYTHPIEWEGFIFFTIFWGGPISIVLFKQIQKEVKLLKKK